MMVRLAELAAERDWPLLSVGAHPGYTRTNLMTSGPQLGGHRPSLLESVAYKAIPSQGPERGAEPLLYAATSPHAVAGGYYGPRWWLVGAATRAGLPRTGRDKAAAARLWAEAERLTGVSVSDR